MEVQRKAKANGAVNHYRVLGVQQTALLTDVKASYRSVCHGVAVVLQALMSITLLSVGRDLFVHAADSWLSSTIRTRP